jgi:glycosyltransferase involved in cell wall biosynthesis
MHKPKVLVLSTIPVRRSGDIYETDGRWGMDIGCQAEFHSIALICPVQQCTDPGMAVLRSDIEVVPVDEADLRALVDQTDIVQLPGNFGWRQSRIVRQLSRLARDRGKPVFLGISSDRAKTAWMNRKRGLLGIAKGLLCWADVRSSQWFLARRSTGVFVVGHGIARLARPNPNVHVGTASWISARDIFKRPSSRKLPISICCASRLEAMKGVEVGVYAVGELASVCLRLRFDIVGEGPEREELEAIAERAGIRLFTRFIGQLDYPDEFLSYLRSVDFVLLTNLNDEQPRLIFDAISQGCLPICPNSAPYLALGLDRRLLYDRGRPEMAAAALLRLIRMREEERREIEVSLRTLAREFTLEAMHRRRADWMRNTSLPTLRNECA